MQMLLEGEPGIVVDERLVVITGRNWVDWRVEI